MRRRAHPDDDRKRLATRLWRTVSDLFPAGGLAAAIEHRHLLLNDATGGAIDDRVLDPLAEPVEVTGRVLRAGDLLVLRAEPAAVRRLGSPGGA